MDKARYVSSDRRLRALRTVKEQGMNSGLGCAGDSRAGKYYVEMLIITSATPSLTHSFLNHPE